MPAVIQLDPALYLQTWPTASYAFDGATAVQTGLSFDSSPYTFEFDFNLSNLSSQQTLISQRNDTGGGGGWAFFVATNGSMTLVHVGVATLTTASGLISAGTDYSLRVVVKPNNTAEIFLDDASVATGSVGALATPPIDITLGARGDAQQYTTGTISDFRYGSGPLTDQTGGGNDGALVGSTAVTDGVIVFPDDGASRVTLPTTGIDKTQGTIALWWRPDSTSANWRFFTDNPSGARIVFLQSESGANANKFTLSVDSRSQTTSSAYTLAAETWHHLAATWDTVADAFLVYVDGAAVSMAAASGTLGANTLGSTMHLGANNTLNHVLDGDVDKFLVADEAYSSAQIAELASAREFPGDASAAAQIRRQRQPTARLGL